MIWSVQGYRSMVCTRLMKSISLQCRSHRLLSLKSHIVYIKELEAGAAVSYGGTFVAEKTMKVATVPVGYGDGYPRSLSK